MFHLRMVLLPALLIVREALLAWATSLQGPAAAALRGGPLVMEVAPKWWVYRGKIPSKMIKNG